METAGVENGLESEVVGWSAGVARYRPGVGSLGG